MDIKIAQQMTITELVLENQKLKLDAQREAEHHDRMVGELEKIYKELDTKMNNTKIDDGGTAFPVAPGIGKDGMSLRDWFAGQALGHIPALLAANDLNKSVEQIADWAGQVADAMLVERKQKEGAR